LKTNIILWLGLSFQLINFSSKAQTHSIEFADSLYKKMSYSSAASAFERVYFFSTNTDERIRALIDRSLCLKNLGQYYESYKSLARVLNFELDDSLKCYANFQLALYLYLSGYYTDAEKYCMKNHSIPITTVDYKNSILLHGFILNELNRYDAAPEFFFEYNSSSALNDSCKNELNSFIEDCYNPKKIPNLKSLKKAKRLSSVIPGMGLFYAGEPGKAIINILLQLGALTYTGINIYFTNYITAATTGVFLIRIFYVGGINQLNDIIPVKNYQKSRKFNAEFKEKYLKKLITYGVFFQ